MTRLVELCLLAAFAIPAMAEDAPLTIGPRRTAPAPTPAPDISPILKRLKANELATVDGAAQELADNHPNLALAPLWALYNDLDGERRMIAIRALAKLPLLKNAKGVSSQPDDLFKVAVADSFLAIRRAALRGMARLETHDAAAERFLAALADAQRFKGVYRYRLMSALAALDSDVARRKVIESLKGTDDLLAVAAADGVGANPGVEIIDALLAALNTEDRERKPAMVDALERISGYHYRFDLLKWTEWRKGGMKPPEPVASGSSTVQPDGYPDLTESPLDVVVIFDTTGSMTTIWPQIRASVDAVLREFEKRTPSLRVGLVRYRASDPARASKYLLYPTDLTRRIDEIHTALEDASFGGGSGGLHLGLGYAIGSMMWRPYARKVIVLVGDTSPEGDTLKSCMINSRDCRKVDSIQVDTLYVRTTHGEEHRETYRLIAVANQGRFYEYNKAERKLVDMGAEKIDVRGTTELPWETAQKWCLPSAPPKIPVMPPR